MNFFIVLRKELMEQWRTKRLLVILAVMAIFGLISPLLAKLTPDLLKSIPDMPAGLADLIPEPTLTDAVLQYVKNLEQFGILLALLMSMGSVAQEKERGTAAMMLTHPLSRAAFLLAKFAALAVTFTLSLTVAALACWYYTLLLFEALPWDSFLALNGLMLVGFFVYIAATILCSTLVRSQGAAAGLAFGALVLIAGIGSLPRIGTYFPGQLFNWGVGLALGAADPAWPALWVSLGLIVTFLGIAWLVFRRQEL
ncbi:MAG: ABC transporter permease subunit [Anaerolineales bacterium]|nr:ABC transporter permease subunit [Anaerolineales bacterium]